MKLLLLTKCVFTNLFLSTYALWHAINRAGAMKLFVCHLQFARDLDSDTSSFSKNICSIVVARTVTILWSPLMFFKTIQRRIYSKYNRYISFGSIFQRLNEIAHLLSKTLETFLDTVCYWHITHTTGEKYLHLLLPTTEHRHFCSSSILSSYTSVCNYLWTNVSIETYFLLLCEDLYYSSALLDEKFCSHKIHPIFGWFELFIVQLKID